MKFFPALEKCDVGAFGIKPFIAREKRPQWPGGVWGDPAKANPDKGRELFERSARRMVALVRALEARLAAD